MDMQSNNDSFLSVNNTVKRQLEEVVDGIDKNIIKHSADDEALVNQTYGDTVAGALCERYKQMIEDIDSVNKQIQSYINQIGSDRR